MNTRLVYTCLLLLCAALAGAQPEAPANADDASAERAVERALRAALLDDAEAVRAVARLRRRDEQALPTERPIAENIEALAVATTRPLPTAGQLRQRLSEYGRDQGTLHLDRLLKRIEPRQRFDEARKDQRYERQRRLFNAFSGPLSATIQGQFGPLLALPFEGIDWLVVGRHYPTPEQRKELYTARDAAEFPASDPISRRARNVIDNQHEKRLRLAALQARLNGGRAVDDEQYHTAIFWYQREREIRQWSEARRSGEKEALRHVTRAQAQRRESLTVIDGDAKFFAPEEFAAYGRVLRTLALPDDRLFEQAARDFMIDYPMSASASVVQAALAGRTRQQDEQLLARVVLEDLAGPDEEESLWRARARGYLERPVYTPEVILENARAEIRERFWDYVIKGEDPTITHRSLTTEEARLSRQSWVAKARGLFIADILARTLFLPLTGPFPRPELVDAAAQVDPQWFESEEGRVWLRRVRRAQEVEKRHRDAAESARRLGEFSRALRIERRAARHLERLADAAPRPAEAAAIYQRLLSAYPSYRRRERVERSLAEAQVRTRTVAIITREELLAYPELWNERGLLLNPALLDGRRSTGEIDRDGVRVLSHGAYSYIDRQTGRRVEVPIDEERRQQVLAELEPRRRSGTIGEELRKPLPRRRIPIAVEAGVFPGFDVTPGLVPLEPDPAERALYE